MKTGAFGSRSSAASSGKVASFSYASSTKRHVVSMPFQSSKSLKAARPLTSRAAQNIANQNHPVPQNQAQNASTCDSARGLWGVRRALRRELQHGLALADHAHLLAGELLDVERVVAQPVHRARELLLFRAQRPQPALRGPHVAARLPSA